jgi:hypothetical protein
MSLISLSVNNATGQFVQGINNSAVAPKPNLFCPDNPTVKVYLLDPIIGQIIPPLFTSTLTAGNTFFMYLDDGILNTTNIYAQLLSISTGTDAGGNFWQGTFALNAGPLETLVLAGGTAGASVFLQIGYVSNAGIQTTVYSQPQQVLVGIPNGSVGQLPAGQTALGLQAATQLFFPQQPPNGLPLRLVSPLGKVLLMSYVDNPDGTASLAETPLN